MDKRLKKRTAEEICSPVSKKIQKCILHYETSKCGSFTYLTDTKNPIERLKYLHDMRDIRMSQPIGSKHRMESICALIPNDIGTDCGYHGDCYQNFIRNVRRLKRDVCIAGTSKDFQVTRRGASSDKVALFSKDCIFCNKEGHIGVKKSGSWTSEANKKFQSESWQTVVEHAKSKGDEKLLLRIRDVDLFAAEAHFHPSCRKDM
ncbi:hypothetical protein ACF0H5_003493 [Mactra antiquata]